MLLKARYATVEKHQEADIGEPAWVEGQQPGPPEDQHFVPQKTARRALESRKPQRNRIERKRDDGNEQWSWKVHEAIFINEACWSSIIYGSFAWIAATSARSCA